MNTTEPTSIRPTTPGRWESLAGRPAIATTAIWTSVLLMAILAPDMVHGSAQEHLPITALTAWVWGAAATAYVVLTPRTLAPAVRRSWTLGIGVVWLAALLLVVLSPVLVTGTDPTRVPLAVWVVPPLAAVATGLFALWAAKQPTPGSAS